MNVSLLFLRPLVLTLVIEGTAAVLLGVRGRNLLLVLLANVLTNPLLHLLAGSLSGWLSRQGIHLLVYAVLEPLVILLEGEIYARGMKEQPHPRRLSFILNVCSVLGGVIWNLFF